MVKYEFIKKLEREGTLKTAISMGIVSTTVGRHKVIYETYLKNRSKVSTYSLAIENTASDIRCSSRLVESIVSDFRR